MEEKMKKTLSLLAVLLVLVFAVSCGSGKKDNKDTNDTDTIDDTDVVDTDSDTEPTEEPTEEPTDEPTEPEPTEPTNPTEPEPTDPTNPTEPEPTDPTEPEPTDPTDPTEPEPTDPTEPTEEPVETHELIGRYRDNYGMPHAISNTAWYQPSSGWGDALFHITQFNSEEDFIIAHNDEEIAQGNGGQWSRFDYTEKDGKLYYCQIAYNEDTEEAALAVTTADRTDPANSGCGTFSWTELIKIVEEPIDKDADEIVAWATGYENYTVGENVDDEWKTPEKALGKAEGTSSDVVVLGEGGSIVLIFDKMISDDDGPDFAVFENSFNDGFLELAKVAVSSDGVHYVTFDNYYLGLNKVGQYDNDTQKQENIWGFAGKFRAGKGTMFDLADLMFKPEVEDELVDIYAITHIKIIDVIGDGSQFDTMGDPIYDPYPNIQSAGFDLDAVGIINTEDPESEFYGKYNEGGYTDHFISDYVWTMSSSYGTSIFHINKINTDSDYIIAQNDDDETYSYNPSLWSRFDYVIDGNDVYYCQIAYNAATKADAIAATGADRTDLTTAGCNGFPWSKMTKVNFLQ